jgi:hypothetical protein
MKKNEEIKELIVKEFEGTGLSFEGSFDNKTFMYQATGLTDKFSCLMSDILQRCADGDNVTFQTSVFFTAEYDDGQDCGFSYSKEAMKDFYTMAKMFIYKSENVNDIFLKDRSECPRMTCDMENTIYLDTFVDSKTFKKQTGKDLTKVKAKILAAEKYEEGVFKYLLFVNEDKTCNVVYNNGNIHFKFYGNSSESLIKLVSQIENGFELSEEDYNELVEFDKIGK